MNKHCFLFKLLAILASFVAGLCVVGIITTVPLALSHGEDPLYYWVNYVIVLSMALGVISTNPANFKLRLLRSTLISAGVVGAATYFLILSDPIYTPRLFRVAGVIFSGAIAYTTIGVIITRRHY